MKLPDKYALVTGASKGIGRALAIGLAREGAHVMVNYHSDETGARETAQAIEALGRRAPVVQADIARVSDIQRMFGELRRQFGRIDVLINNAAVTGWTSIFEVTEAQWDWVLDTNLKGTFFVVWRRPG